MTLGANLTFGEHKIKPSGRFHFAETHDIDDQAALLRGWNQTYAQMSSGPFAGSIAEAHIAGAQLFLEETHTAEHLQLAMESVLDDWNIDYVFACVSDNAANVVSAMHNCGRILYNLKCCGHTSQLAVNKALTAEGTITESVNAIRKVARFFRKSGPAWNKLKESQSHEIKRRKEENRKPPHDQQDPAVKRLKPVRPIMNCETRWNSKLYMCERMLSLRKHVTIVSQDPTLRKEMNKNQLPSDTQWALVENVVGILRSFVNEINTWSGEKYATLSSIYPTIFGLLDLIKVPQCEEDFKLTE